MRQIRDGWQRHLLFLPSAAVKTETKSFHLFPIKTSKASAAPPPLHPPSPLNSIVIPWAAPGPPQPIQSPRLSVLCKKKFAPRVETAPPPRPLTPSLPLTPALSWPPASQRCGGAAFPGQRHGCIMEEKKKREREGGVGGEGDKELQRGCAGGESEEGNCGSCGWLAVSPHPLTNWSTPQSCW